MSLIFKPLLSFCSDRDETDEEMYNRWETEEESEEERNIRLEKLAIRRWEFQARVYR